MRRRAKVMTALAVSMALTTAAGAAEPSAPCVAVPAVDDKCEAWTASYNHAGGRGGLGEDIGRAVAVAPDGRVYVAGLSRDDTTQYDAVVAAFDDDGAALWQTRAATPAYDTFSAVAVSADGQRVFASGRSVGVDETFDWSTSAFDAKTGAELWRVRHASEDPLDEVSWTVDTSPDARTVYVGGYVDHDAVVVAYDAASGALVWEDTFDADGDFDQVRQLTVAGDGTVYAAGQAGSRATGDDLLVLSYGSDGTRRWDAQVDRAQRNDWAWTLAVDGARTRVAVTGTSRSTRGDKDILTVVFDAATGVREWMDAHDGGAGGDDTPAGVAFSPDGTQVYAGGTSREAYPALGEYVVIAYDASTGQQTWRRLHEHAYNDTATAMTVTADGARVVLTGYWLFPRGEIRPVFKIEPGWSQTVAFDTDGNRTWTARHTQSGVGADVAVAIAPAHTGRRVHTAGTFVTSGVYVYPTDKASAYAYDLGTAAYDS